MEFRTKREAEEAAGNREERAVIARDLGHPDIARRLFAEAARIRALLHTLPE